MLRFDQIKRIVDSSGWTQDADETMAFARQLETLMAGVYEVELAERKARVLIPMAPRVDPADETFTYRQKEYKGSAKIVHSYSHDFPTVEIVGSEKTHKVKSIGNSYDYSVEDLRKALKSGWDLDGEKAHAARETMEFKLEAIASRGDSDNGIATGFFNAPSINSVTLATKTAGGTRWFKADGSPNASVAEILADVNMMQSKIHTATKGLRHGDTLVVDTLTYGGLFTTARAPGFTDDTIGQYLLKQSPWLKSIEHWVAADTGDGTNPRAMLYWRDQKAVQLVIPREFEQFAPQAKNMSFHVPCHMKTGGVIVNLPLTMCYADGIAS